MSTSPDPRAEYRRRLKHRQTTVVGGILAVMAVLVVLGLMVGSGVLPAPWDPGFSSASDGATAPSQPCPPSDATTVDLTSLTVNVYNGTDTAGLASGVSGTLANAGLTVQSTADWPKGTYDGDVELTTSPAGLTNAYSLARVFSGTVIVQLDETQDPADTSVSVVLGSQYTSTLMSTDEIAQVQAGSAITAPTQCAPLSSASGSASPSAAS